MDSFFITTYESEFETESVNDIELFSKLKLSLLNSVPFFQTVTSPEDIFVIEILYLSVDSK